MAGPAETDETASPPGDGPGDDAGTPPADDGGDGFEDRVRQVLEAMFGEEDGAGTPDDGGDGGDAVTTTTARTTESTIEDHVRRELGKVRKEEALEETVKAQGETIKKLAEKPPRQFRRITLAVWGGE